MAWFVYVLVSPQRRTYVGIAVDVARRLRQHNGELRGGARSTRVGRPWAIGRVVGPLPSRGQALSIEYAVKQRKGNRRLVWQPPLALMRALGKPSRSRRIGS